MADRSNNSDEFSAPHETTEPLDAGVGHEVEVRVCERGIDTHGLRVGLAVDEARESVDTIAPDARAGMERVPAVVLIEHHPDRKVRRVQPEFLEVVAQLLDARLVPNGRERKVGAARPVGRIFLRGSVHHVERFGLRVPGLVVVVAQRPCR